eukprot:s2045_g2.t1
MALRGENGVARTVGGYPNSFHGTQQTSRQLLELQRQLKEMRSNMNSSKMQMEGEVSAWQAICNDAREATQQHERQRAANEVRKVHLEEEVRQLRSSLQDAESEVARIHAMTSSLEAKRLHAADRAREEIKELLEWKAIQAPKELELRSELASARQRAEILRLECSEERQRCRQLVSRLAPACAAASGEKKDGCFFFPISEGSDEALGIFSTEKPNLHSRAMLNHPANAPGEVMPHVQSAEEGQAMSSTANQLGQLGPVPQQVLLHLKHGVPPAAAPEWMHAAPAAPCLRECLELSQGSSEGPLMEESPLELYHGRAEVQQAVLQPEEDPYQEEPSWNSRKQRDTLPGGATVVPVVPVAGRSIPTPKSRKANLHKLREWLEPTDIQESMEQQRRFVRPHAGSLWRTLALTVLPALYFLGRVLPRTQHQASHVGRPGVFCTAWGITSLLALAAAAFRNPGVVPRSGDKRASAPARFVKVNGIELKQSWCNTCRVYRPLRSKHCAYCDRCVFQFDHHCTWLGNCVGLGNYRSFLLVVLAAAAFFGHSALITCKVLWRLFFQADPKMALRKFFIANVGELLYMTYAFTIFLGLGVLLLYHCIIIGCNLTTNEHVRDYYLHLERNGAGQNFGVMQCVWILDDR